MLVPPHPKSQKSNSELTCLYFESSVTTESGLGLIDGIAGAAIGLAIDQTSKALEKEANRYKATFSVRGTQTMYTTTGWNNQRNRSTKIRKKFDTLRVVRFVDVMEQDCSKLRTANAETDPNVAFQLKIGVNIGPGGRTMELVPQEMNLNMTKAKVAALRGWPHTWWRYLDKTAGKLDVNARVIVTIVDDTSTPVVQQEVLRADIPLGQVDLNNRAATIDLRNRNHTSGWSGIPGPNAAIWSKYEENEGIQPLTVVLTITEADSIGDVIGEAGKQLHENKDKLKTEALKALGLSK
jgi:hypothetical protein